MTGEIHYFDATSGRIVPVEVEKNSTRKAAFIFVIVKYKVKYNFNFWYKDLVKNVLDKLFCIVN